MSVLRGEAEMIGEGDVAWVMCEECKCETDMFFGTDDATDVWNRRTTYDE